MYTLIFGGLAQNNENLAVPCKKASSKMLQFLESFSLIVDCPSASLHLYKSFRFWHSSGYLKPDSLKTLLGLPIAQVYSTS